MTAIGIIVLAHNEEARIATCLASLASESPGAEIHVVVNGATDRTAAIARGFADVIVHEYAQGGKSRSWNRFVLDECADAFETLVFVDGDAEIAPGSIVALAAALAADPHANACAGLPLNGRHAAAYRAEIVRTHGLFGDLYALRGSFVARMRASGIRLPDDLIGDDSLIGALAKTDLRNETHWDETRIIAAPDAGFRCAPAALLKPSTVRIQYRRMINYSVRFYQNRIISHIMRGAGPTALPRTLASLYPQWLQEFTPRAAPHLWWFDRRALARMRAAAAPDRSAHAPD